MTTTGLIRVFVRPLFYIRVCRLNVRPISAIVTNSRVNNGVRFNRPRSNFYQSLCSYDGLIREAQKKGFIALLEQVP